MNEISHNKLPRHVAIIMDGNGRWAERKSYSRVKGHEQGIETARNIVHYAAQLGISVMTLFAFSSENWRRPSDEVNAILNLLLNALNTDSEELNANRIKLRIIGNQSRFSEELKQQIAYSQHLTKENQHFSLVIAVDYGGQWDITQAVQTIVERAVQGQLKVSQINSELINSYLQLADLPHPDLFIRTGGEQRLSNFYLWQLAYAELYFSEKYWPDFDKDEFDKALQFFSTRQRRFGLTGNQLKEFNVHR